MYIIYLLNTNDAKIPQISEIYGNLQGSKKNFNTTSGGQARKNCFKIVPEYTLIAPILSKNHP